MTDAIEMSVRVWILVILTGRSASGEFSGKWNRNREKNHSRCGFNSIRGLVYNNLSNKIGNIGSPPFITTVTLFNYCCYSATNLAAELQLGGPFSLLKFTFRVHREAGGQKKHEEGREVLKTPAGDGPAASVMVKQVPSPKYKAQSATIS